MTADRQLGCEGDGTPPRWERLAARAQLESPPPVDVTQRVMAAISVGPRERAVEPALLVCALGSLAAAGVVGALAAGWWSDLSDPITDLLLAVNVVLQ